MNPRIARLGLLYFVQGIPIGIQFGVLPILMRERGASRTEIAVAGALSIPWMLKVLWAPIVDTVHVRSIGRRRTWILPLQLLVACVLAALAVLAGRATDASLVPLFVGLFVMNLAMATMDVAVDGLAVDWLSDAELGPGNAAQIGGFKLGMLFASGVALQFLRVGSWSAVFGAMAAVVFVAFLSTLTFHEPEQLRFRPAERVGAADLLAMTRQLLVDPASRALLLVVLLYKAGEAMADSQWKPFLVDVGFSAEDIGLTIGMTGMLASTAGSIVAGGIGARSRSLVLALFVVAAVRVLPIVGETIVVATHPGRPIVIAVSFFENFGGGLLTTLVYALMMSSADPARAGTSFTLLSTVDALGKGMMTFVAGVLADVAGDVVVFSCAVALSVGFLGLYGPLRRHEARGAYRRASLLSSDTVPDPSA